MTEDNRDDSPRHTIGVVADRTGLSPHVLRAWERRYNVVSPGRSQGGQRFYSDADVNRLSLLVRASAPGRSVGHLAHLSDDELARLVSEDAERGMAAPPASSEFRARAMDAIRDMAPDKLQSLLRRALLSVGTTSFLDEIVAPLLVEVGDEWHAERISIAHEHLASAAVEQVLAWLARELSLPADAPRVLLATPAGQRHGIGSLMAAVTAASDGWHVIWLGTDLPVSQIAAAATSHRAHVVALGITVLDDAEGLKAALGELRSELTASTSLVVGGMAADRLADVDGVAPARTLAHWRKTLRANAPTGSTR